MTSSNFSPQKGGGGWTFPLLSPPPPFFCVCVCGAKINHCHCVELFERTTGWERVVQFFQVKGGRKVARALLLSGHLIPPPPPTETE